MKKQLCAAMVGCVISLWIPQVVTAETGNNTSDGWSPIGCSLVTNLGVPSSGYDIYGVNCNLLTGSHHCVYGFDFGGLADWTQHDMIGLQASIFYSKAGNEMRGVQLAVVNSAETLGGLQLGVFNYAFSGQGIQIGLVNMSKLVGGIQIGAVNFNARSTCKCLPLVNFSF